MNLEKRENKVDNMSALFFYLEIYSRQINIYVLELVPSHNN